MLVEDGEGATKFVQIDVSGARSQKEARQAARKISTSCLLKCCIFGEDPNWGRVAAACGSSGVEFNPDRVDIYLGDIKVLSSGSRVEGYDVERTKKIFRQKDIVIKVDLKSGRHKASAWTCDFSKEYVEINSEYST
jgi:glutamate N-acetyltransferase/amino-acid N-acetyltransferase